MGLNLLRCLGLDYIYILFLRFLVRLFIYIYICFFWGVSPNIGEIFIQVESIYQLGDAKFEVKHPPKNILGRVLPRFF